MGTLRTLGGFGSGKALFRAVGIKVQDPIMPDGVVAAGYLSILHASKTVANAQQRQAWKRRYFVLRSTGQLDYYKSGRYGVGTNAKGGALLSGEYFVGDSLLRPHGFQVSDFETTVYLACDTAADQIDWMFKIGTQRDTAPASTHASAHQLTATSMHLSLSAGTVVRMLQDGSNTSWDATAKKACETQIHMALASPRGTNRPSGAGAGGTGTGLTPRG